jgi:hypothetical protein
VKNQQGVTLIEIILVLVIALAITFLSVQQYLAYRHDANIMQIRYNVDTLFQALTNYFRANCRSNSSFNTYNAGVSVPVTLPTLTSGGYLTSSIPANPLVDGTGQGAGYITQFNQYQMTSTGVYPYLPQRTATLSTASGGNTVSTGYITVWQAQVAVNLNNPTNDPNVALAYQEELGADCLSDMTSAGWSGGYVVTACEFSPIAANYVVWTRAPTSSLGSNGSSPYWLSLPVLKEFTQLYTTDPILILTDQTQTASQYYVCGS